MTTRLEKNTDAGRVMLDESVVDDYLRAAIAIRTRAKNLGLKLNTSTAAEIMSLRGVLRPEDEIDIAVPIEGILDTVQAAADAFLVMRQSEGEALAGILHNQLDHITQCVQQAATLAKARKAQVSETFRANLTSVLENADGLDETRVAQELALLAVKSDVTEEIDRLGAHVEAARVLLAQDGSIGRKLDFLMQEFNREANTLCAKSQNVELTQIGLELKATIDQMREQVQNVE